MRSRKERRRERVRVIRWWVRGKGGVVAVFVVVVVVVSGELGGVGKSCSMPRERREGRGPVICIWVLAQCVSLVVFLSVFFRMKRLLRGSRLRRTRRRNSCRSLMSEAPGVSGRGVRAGGLAA